MFKEENGVTYFEKIICAGKDPTRTASSDAIEYPTTAAELNTTWAEAPGLSSEKMVDILFQVPAPLMQRVASSGFDALILSTLRCECVFLVH